MLMHRELPNPFLARRQSTVVQGGCPNGGQWYSCGAQQSGFIGCCTSNPCTSVGCVAGNLRAASLGDIPFNTTPDQTCLAGGEFYTCVGPPPFWGCCKSNPCGVGCPQTDLAPASLIQNPDNPFKTPSSTASATTSPGSGSGGSSTPTGAIVGGVVGGVLGLALIGVLIFWIRRRKNADKPNAPTAPMAFNPHSQQADPGSNVPLTYPEVVDHYATSPPPMKQNYPPSAFTSPALPQYSDNRRMSHELAGGHDNSGYISPMNSPGFVDQRGHTRPISYELHGTGSPGIPPKGGMHTPSIMSTAVSELPAEDMRYSQVSSNMRYSGQPPSSPPPQPPSNEASGAGLGLSMHGQSGER